MAIKLSNLKTKIGARHPRKRIGRGNASGHGTYSGRGQKGQRSRSGGKKGLKIRGLRRNIRNLPKSRGFHRHFIRMQVVNLKDIEAKFKKQEIVNPAKLIDYGLIRKKPLKIKILARGKITKKLTIEAHAFSKTSEQAIEKAGGKVVKL